MKADLISRRWCRIDLKLALDGQLHVIRWRRGLLADAVYFDGRKVAQSDGIFGRETIFGLEMNTADGAVVRMLLSVDPAENVWDMKGDMRPGGVRLETADEVLLAIGTLGPGRIDRMRQTFGVMYDRASRLLGLS